MKKTLFSIFALLVLITGCKNDSEGSGKVIFGYYDSMHFERTGGGAKSFDLFKTEDPNKLIANVSKLNYRDTTVQVIINKDVDNATTFSDFDKALNSQIQLNGDFVESTLFTGSWAQISFSKNNELTQVTNINLRNSLLKLERIVEENIK